MEKKYRPICKLVFPGEPLTKSNAAIAKWNKKTKKPFFTHKASVIKYEKALKQYALEHCKTLGITPVKAPIRLTLIYYFGSRRIKDVQNCPKTSCDALIGSVYVDDYYICEIYMEKLLDPENPRVEIYAEEILVSGKGSETLYPITTKVLGTTKSNKSVSTKKRRKRKRKGFKKDPKALGASGKIPEQVIGQSQT